MRTNRFSPESLRAFREAAGRTQAEAAIACGSDVRSIRNWETAVYVPSGTVLADLATLYGVEPGEFFDHESDANSLAENREEAGAAA